VIAILAAVFNHAHPRLASPNAGPQVAERFGRHVWVSDYVVVLAEHFVFIETADLYEVGVYVGDVAVEVGSGQDVGRLTE